MSSPLRYEFDIKWSGLAIAVLFSGGMSFIAACWAKSLGGILSIGPAFVSVAFALLALRIIARRIMFPKVLEVTDDAIIFPGGFTGKRTTRIAFAEIMRMANTGIHPGLYMVTAKGNFEILSIRFRTIENYRAVRSLICSKTSISLSEGIRRTWDSGWVPGPVLKWSEPEEYIRYRTHLVVSRPLWPRLARAIRFFACVFGFFFLPWLGLNFFLSVGTSAIGFLAILIPACLFFTWLHWLNATYPARVTHITIYPEGFSQLSGLQTRSFKYGDFLGWSVVQREFIGRIFDILLLQRPKYLVEITFPDVNTRDQIIQILNENKVPHVDDLKPSWELKS